MAELDLALREGVDRLRGLADHPLSSHAFPSLFLWREHLGLEIVLREDCFAVRAAKRGANAWFFPCGGEGGKLAFFAAHGGEPGLELFYLRPEDAAWLRDRFPGRWEIFRRPEGDEYLYERASHVEMAGGEFRHLRWRVHRIERELVPRTRVLDRESAVDARYVLDAWSSAHPGGGADDRMVALRALEHWEALGLRGVVVYLAERPAAFMLGFPLSEETFDAAVGKCAVDVQGLTYYVLRELMLSLPGRYRWFNLEEDLGLPGLRAMKEHFLPDGRHEMWGARRL